MNIFTYRFQIIIMILFYFCNIQVTYKCAMGCESQADFNAGISAFRNMLASRTGYKRLEDEINTSEYRMACFRGGISVPTLNKETATFDVVFDCKPQRYLIKGNQTLEDVTGQLLNPTLYDALPIIRAYGTGSFSINGVSVTISTANVYTDIDCERMEAYKGTINCNANINAPVFPKLAPGLNTITTNMRLDITPRWWEL